MRLVPRRIPFERQGKGGGGGGGGGGEGGGDDEGQTKILPQLNDGAGDGKRAQQRFHEHLYTCIQKEECL